jgi:hypothetical protein
MPRHDGVVRRYAVGLAMETVPSYWCCTDQEAGTPALPRPLVGSQVQPHRTGAAALQQAVALLTGKRIAASSVVTATAMWRHARRHLSGFRVELAWEQEPSVLLAQCLGAVSAGGLVLLQWQPLPRIGSDSLHIPAAPACWVLVVGVEQSWQAQNDQAPGAASALLALNATVPLVWGCGHNQHLKPEVGPDSGDARWTELPRPVWVARTLDGGVECGLLLAAVAIYPPALG